MGLNIILVTMRVDVPSGHRRLKENRDEIVVELGVGENAAAVPAGLEPSELDTTVANFQKMADTMKCTCTLLRQRKEVCVLSLIPKIVQAPCSTTLPAPCLPPTMLPCSRVCTVRCWLQAAASSWSC